MQYEKLEDVPEKDLERAWDYLGAAVRLSPSKTALRIAKDISSECLLRGDCRLTHSAFSRNTGACRRTVDRALKTLLRVGLIARVSKSETGHWIYAAQWDRGSEYRGWSKAFDDRWTEAQKAGRLRHFQAPDYPAAGEAARGQI